MQISLVSHAESPIGMPFCFRLCLDCFMFFCFLFLFLFFPGVFKINYRKSISKHLIPIVQSLLNAEKSYLNLIYEIVKKEPI